MSSTPTFLKFSTAENFRYRLALSILSGKPIRISKIRIKNITNPGLEEYEANLLKLIDLITNGTQIEINPSGTSLTFIPGILLGGDLTDETYFTNTNRGLGYYLEFLFLIAPFCKEKLKIKLNGITNGHAYDTSIDVFKASGMMAIRKFLNFDDHLAFTLDKRSIGVLQVHQNDPENQPKMISGSVTFSCPNPNKLKTIQENYVGKISKIRGNCYSCRVPPQLATRVGKIIRNSFSEHFKNVFVYNEVNKCDKFSKGYGLVLVGETVNGQNENIATFSCEKSNFGPFSESKIRELSDNLESRKANFEDENDISKEITPEILGHQILNDFLKEMANLGVIDSHFQPLACLYMTMTEQDVSSITLGPLTKNCIDMLRLIKIFFNVTFKVDIEEQNDDSEDEEDTTDLQKEDRETKEEASEVSDSEDSDTLLNKIQNKNSRKRKLPLPPKTNLACVGVGFSNLVKRRI